MSRYLSATLKRRLRQQAQARCGYCLSSEALTGQEMEIEHLRPLAAGGRTVEDNLWLACRRCNDFIGASHKKYGMEVGESKSVESELLILFPN